MAADAYNARTHCDRNVQRTVGLDSTDINPPRIGDRTACSSEGYDVTGCRAHMLPFSEAVARDLFDALPAALKDTPPDGDVAYAIGRLAKNAGRDVPDGCITVMGNRAPDTFVSPLAYYTTPGSPIIQGVTNSNKFITFIFRNMDNGHRVKWYDLTGREQNEWYDAWIRCGKGYVRNENETRGLRGTNLGDLTAANLETAMVRSPSLVRRRPGTHAVTEAEWGNTARRIFS